MKTPQFLLRLFKKPPATPTRRVEQPNYRSFTTPAQIQAYCEARFDRLKWLDGEASEQHVREPGFRGAALQLGEPRDSIAVPGRGFELTSYAKGERRQSGALRGHPSGE